VSTAASVGSLDQLDRTLLLDAGRGEDVEGRRVRSGVRCTAGVAHEGSQLSTAGANKAIVKGADRLAG
jgi:hypothetical protein